jgi:hypothetical protein
MEKVKPMTRLPLARPMQEVSDLLLNLEQAVFNVQEWIKVLRNV